MVKLLTRAAILACTDIQTETVKVPEWGGSVMVRGLTGAERDAFEASLIVGKGKNRDIALQNVRAKLVTLSATDGTGARLFSDLDAQALGEKSAAALQRVFEAAQRLSGLTDKDVEELTKNSESGQSDGSPTV